MIDFMVISYPRSGSTWASVWLTTDKTLCLHDPLYKYHYEDLDKIESKKTLGISCTNIGIFSDFLNKHPAKKVILHRDINEVNKSLSELELPEIPEFDLNKINGLHCYWMDIWNDPKLIWDYLMDSEFDFERHKELSKIHMQPTFEKIEINKEATRRLVKEMQEVIWPG